MKRARAANRASAELSLVHQHADLEQSLLGCRSGTALTMAETAELGFNTFTSGVVFGGVGTTTVLSQKCVGDQQDIDVISGLPDRFQFNYPDSLDCCLTAY